MSQCDAKSCIMLTDIVEEDNEDNETEEADPDQCLLCTCWLGHRDQLLPDNLGLQHLISILVLFNVGAQS